MATSEPLAQQVEHRPFKPGVLGSSPRRLTFLSHTADTGFTIQAHSPEEVVFWAIYALFVVMLGENYQEKALHDKKSIKPFVIKGEDLAFALHDLLEEILFLFETKKLIPVEAQSICVDPKEPEIKAKICFARLDPRYEEEITEVKAVTYHRLRFEKKGTVWEAEVILDL